MAEPNTPNIALIVPNTGDLVDTWGVAAVNPDFLAIDGMLGGAAVLGLSGPATTVLTLPTGAISPTSGPNQSQNAIIFTAGTLTGNNFIQLGMPGRYMFYNACLPLNFVVVVYSSGGGSDRVALPPNQLTMLLHDGTSVFLLDPTPIGASLDLVGQTFLPNWMSNTVPIPYLIKDGSLYSIASYPVLGRMLGGTFGGDGVSTFAVPDERGRFRAGFDPGGTGRLTSPVNASSMGSTGGAQSVVLSVGQLPSHIHGVNDPQHRHSNGAFIAGTGLSGFTGGPTSNAVTNGTNFLTDFASTGISIQATGSGNPVTSIPPTIISTLPLIRAG